MGNKYSRFFDFGPFSVDVTLRVLLRDNTPVPLTPKAFDTLLVLVRNSGRIVEKDELLKSVWPDAYVEEAILAQNVFTIRKALGGIEGDEYIQTIPRRGYRFVAEVTAVKEQSANVEDDEFGGPSLDLQVSKTPAEPTTIHSLAVLPLKYESADPNAELLGDGLTESIVNCLSLIPNLQVKACSTVLRYKEQNINPQEAGRELEVGAVLVGKLIQVGENVIVRMELVETAKGWQIWGMEYNEKLSNIHRIQEEIIRSLAGNIRLELTGQEWQRLFKLRSANGEAYQLYLKGRAFLNKRTCEGYKNAIDNFEQAIEIDRGFALAYSGLADCYLLYDFYGIKSPWETIPRARAAAIRAVEIDDQLAETRTSLAAVKLIHDRDAVGAEREFKLALRLNPKYARAHDGYSHCLMAMGHFDESETECKLALEHEPFDLEINQHLGWHYLFARQYDRAIEQLQKTLEMGSNFYRARLLLGIAYGQKGAFSQAIAEFLKARQLEETPILSGFLGHAYAMAGDPKAHEILASLLEESKHTYVPPYSMALIYTGLDNHDEALRWLQEAQVEHGHWRGWLELTPELDRLRSDPRFIEIMQRISSLPG